MRIKDLFIKGIDCIYSFWFDMHFLPFREAIKIPVYISHNMQIKGKITKGSIVINAPLYSRMISLGISEATFGLSGGGQIVFDAEPSK